MSLGLEAWGVKILADHVQVELGHAGYGMVAIPGEKHAQEPSSA